MVYDNYPITTSEARGVISHVYGTDLTNKSPSEQHPQKPKQTHVTLLDGVSQCIYALSRRLIIIMLANNNHAVQFYN